MNTRTTVRYAAALVVAAVAAAPFPATAQQSADDFGRSALATSSQSSWPTVGSVDAALSSADLLGSASLPTPPRTGSSLPAPVGESPVTESRIVSITDDRLPRLERWTIASPAMGRHVDVQILRPAETTEPAPMLYLLDGVDAPRDSGWLHEGHVDELFAEENVTLVMPTGAYASMYADWYADDPVLGRNQWETFLTEELPPLLEDPASGLNFNGRRAIGGLSMGASGAVAIANANPGVFAGVIGISGCYSTTSTAGRIMVGSIVENAGASVYNLYGPPGAPGWDRHNVVKDPRGLASTAVYLSAAEGVVTPEEEEYFGDRTSSALANGIVLEWGSLSCTVDLDQAMRARGMTHQQVDLLPAGVHNWPNFSGALLPGWDHIRPALY
ncbi:alpha/beta hydrolase [Corynebacterium guangdongense]|uniref:S-formylglutathione hydrolase FrmB n=1 Tax=Corynebacterium guangdongense TaxID=1783348 RepID=A0ABU1ZW55_9CORY|nr:alpha/beta hydrolase family protein [Corynebacterium guangdongense]MDR7329146.1 S-formylglutathione hydrolase FrmB [Corynebacterium guangdongense]WJZ17715.1 Diacylglycerol acyltransferase/mycolyltransferase Ag85A precursor [Corynebacterium guangdongense]